MNSEKIELLWIQKFRNQEDLDFEDFEGVSDCLLIRDILRSQFQTEKEDHSMGQVVLLFWPKSGGRSIAPPGPNRPGVKVKILHG